MLKSGIDAGRSVVNLVEYGAAAVNSRLPTAVSDSILARCNKCLEVAVISKIRSMKTPATTVMMMMTVVLIVTTGGGGVDRAEVPCLLEK